MLSQDAPAGTRVEVRLFPHNPDRVQLGTIKNVFSRAHVEVVLDGSSPGASNVIRRDLVDAA